MCWGRNDRGQLGNNGTVTVLPPNLQWRLLACGCRFECSGNVIRGCACAHSIFSQRNNLCSWGSCVGSSVVSQCLLMTPANVIGLNNSAVAASDGNVLAQHTPSRPPPPYNCVAILLARPCCLALTQLQFGACALLITGRLVCWGGNTDLALRHLWMHSYFTFDLSAHCSSSACPMSPGILTTGAVSRFT